VAHRLIMRVVRERSIARGTFYTMAMAVTDLIGMMARQQTVDGVINAAWVPELAEQHTAAFEHVGAYLSQYVAYLHDRGEPGSKAQWPCVKA
jgi:hypothetical protein